MTDMIGGEKPARRKPGPKPKRDRGAAGISDREAQESGLSLDSRETNAHSSKRPERVSMHGAMKLGVNEAFLKPGYTHRWMADTNGRLLQAKAAYWEHVTDEQGQNVIRPSGPSVLYLMRLEEQYAEEDRTLKRNKIAARIRKEAEVGANEYSDHGGDSALSVETGNPYS